MQLQQQRKKITFNVEKLKHLIFGGKSSYEYFQKINQLSKSAFSFDSSLYNLNRKQVLINQIRLSFIISLLKQHLEHIIQFDQMSYILGFMKQNQLVGGIHIAMFIPCIRILGTPNQQKKYLEKAKKFQIVGCYAQTEMAHGSDVQSLMTTATFDPERDEFILNTGSVQSLKWWPGDLGLFANHALVFAQLIINGSKKLLDVKHGTQAFIVQIRDQNHKPLAGIEVGDIGPKIGFGSKDNGYLRLSNIRIPRKNMLSRFVGVSKQGIIKKKGNPKVSYATMLLIRKYISVYYPRIYSIAITIAVRYSFKRTQFINPTTKVQIPIIQYQLQMQKLIPLVCQYYALMFGGLKMQKLSQKNYKNIIQRQDDSLLSQAHNTTCMGKAYSSDVVMNGMQICRIACGGHGYAHYSGLPSLLQQYFANVTHEGQNTVLYLQLSQFIMKSFKNFLMKQKQMPYSIKYLESINHLLTQKCNIETIQMINIENVRKLIAQKVCVNAKQIGKQSKADKGIRVIGLAKAHAHYYYYTSFQQIAIRQTDQQLKAILFNMCLLYGINTFLKSVFPLLEQEIITHPQIILLRDKEKQLLNILKNGLIGIVDGFGMPEMWIRGVIGQNDSKEQMYNKIYSQACKNGLNMDVSKIDWDELSSKIKPKL